MTALVYIKDISKISLLFYLFKIQKKKNFCLKFNWFCTKNINAE